ncbi:MAG: hypothetical protein ISS34_00415 [Candidatus Omnitrophica bacterium]|nr:hypothetical protein [Candidatus Omnitrophota bacterium]
MIDKVAIMNEARERYRLEHEKEIKREAGVSFRRYKNEPLFIAGVTLYWGEGKTTRRDVWNLELNNTDPNLLKLYCSFLRKYLKVDDSLFRVRLFLYTDLNEEKCKSFWSELLGISLSQFIKSYISESRSSVTKNRLPYGTCSVYISSKDLRTTMAIWIEQLVNLYIKN